MKCPRCSLFDIPDGAPACAVCGYQLPGANAEPASPPPSPSSPGPPAPALTELDARRELAREFRIEALLSAGDETTTAVYLAYDPRQDRQVEVKVAPRQPLRDAGAEDRFRRAAEAAAALDHPHILPIYRCGATASFLWFSTKHVEGRSVAELVRTNGPMDLTHCLRILEQVASALDYAHRRGVFHGALSSGNVVLDANEWALAGDFAVAEVVASAREAAAVFNARGPTPGADQYALAALAYECLSGTRPAGEAPPPRATDPAATEPRDTLPTPEIPRPQPDAPRATARPLAPASRPAAPRVTHTAPPKTVVKPTPPPANTGGRMELGLLYVNSLPWGNVYLDGQMVGTVPLKDLPVWPGTHSLRVEREGFQPYERTFEIGSGQQLKITDIVLRELTP